jgi:hypothetical protein
MSGERESAQVRTETEASAPSQEASAVPERRTQKRLLLADVATASVGEKLWNAPVRDISAIGIGILLDQPVEPGTVVSVELPNRAWNCCHLKLLRVIHVTPQPDNRFLVGSVFLRHFSAEELNALVG